jgi:hypothetical protein
VERRAGDEESIVALLPADEETARARPEPVEGRPLLARRTCI